MEELFCWGSSLLTPGRGALGERINPNLSISPAIDPSGPSPKTGNDYNGYIFPWDVGHKPMHVLV